MTTLEFITAINDIFLAIAAATTATVAVIGLNSWRRELKGRTEFDAARNLIRATYKLRDELKQCRAPFISASEFPEDYQGSRGNSSPSEEARAFSYVYRNRWQPVQDAIQEFDTYTLEAEALWGNEIRTRTNQLRQCVKELYVALSEVISNAASGGRDF